MSKTVFDLFKVKTKLFERLFILFKFQNQIFSQAQPLKSLNLKKDWADFRVTGKLFRGPQRPSGKSTFHSEILDSVSHNCWVQHDICPNFFKNHSTLHREGVGTPPAPSPAAPPPWTSRPSTRPAEASKPDVQCRGSNLFWFTQRKKVKLVEKNVLFFWNKKNIS